MGAISWALFHGRYAGALCRGAMQGQQNFYNLRFRFFNNEPFRLSLELR